jgi:hypothetical protein
VVFLQLTHPLCDRNLISARQDVVSEISESMGSRQDSVSILHGEEDGCCTAYVRSDLSTILSSVLTMLGRSLDSQRGITRIFHCKATAKEVKYVHFFLQIALDRTHDPNFDCSFKVACVGVLCIKRWVRCSIPVLTMLLWTLLLLCHLIQYMCNFLWAVYICVT